MAVAAATIAAVTTASAFGANSGTPLGFGPPATGSNGSYSLTVPFTGSVALPPVTGGVTGGTVTFSLSGSNTAGCSVASTGGTVSVASLGRCTVVATLTVGSTEGRDTDRECDGDSDSDDQGCSATLAITVALATQSISVTPETGTVDSSLALVATGYTGSGAITFALASGATAGGCALSGATVTATSAGNCLVTATIAADSGHQGATSAPAVMTFTRKSQSIGVASASGTVGTPVTLVATGYSGTGAVTFAVVSGGTAAGCSVVRRRLERHRGGHVQRDRVHRRRLQVLRRHLRRSGDHLPFEAAQGDPQGDGVERDRRRRHRVHRVRVRLRPLQRRHRHADRGDVHLRRHGGLRAVAHRADRAGDLHGHPVDATSSSRRPLTRVDYVAISYASGTLVIKGGSLTVSASSGSITSGDPFQPHGLGVGVRGRGQRRRLTTVTFTYTGVGSTSYGPSTAQPSGVGAYAITPSGATVAVTPTSHQAFYPSPYDYVAGSLIIAPKPVVITVNPPKPPPRAITMTVSPFPEGSYALSAKLRTQVLKVARAVRAARIRTVSLTGYTDNVFTPAFNALVELNRAKAVALQLGVDLNKLHVHGVTITVVPAPTIVLVATNATAKGRAANRRVVATLGPAESRWAGVGSPPPRRAVRAAPAPWPWWSSPSPRPRWRCRARRARPRVRRRAPSSSPT